MTTMRNIPPRFVLLGVPSSAGAHHAGQELAAAALRRRGLVDRLVGAGLRVSDHGDVAGEVFTADPAHPSCRNLAAVLRVARAVADAVAACRANGTIPIVVGGDCTITLGVVAGVQRSDPSAGLLYFDGDADLSTPARTRSGILDATGIAHLLGIADTELSRLDGRYPILDDDHLIMIGFDETDPDSFDGNVLASRPRLRHFADYVVRADPAGTAQEAVTALAGTTGSAIVHFDVDAVDSGDLPLGNFPHYGTGVELDSAQEVLRILYSAPGLAAIVLTEVNPTHDPGGAQLDRYVQAVTSALGAAFGQGVITELDAEQRSPPAVGDDGPGG
jgi:arginase